MPQDLKEKIKVILANRLIKNASLKSMKYQKIPDKVDRRKKLLPKHLKIAKTLRKLGLSYGEIATILKVSKSIIIYHLNLKYKEKERQRMAIRDAERWADKDFRKKYKAIDRESHFYRFWVNKKYKKWNRVVSLKRYYLKVKK